MLYYDEGNIHLTVISLVRTLNRYIAILVMFAIVCAISWLHQQFGAKPTVFVKGGPVYFAGDVPYGQAITHDFYIENRHPFNMEISSPEVGCSCTTAKISSERIPPFGSACVTVSVAPESTTDVSGSALLESTHGKQSVQTWLAVSGTMRKRVFTDRLRHKPLKD